MFEPPQCALTTGITASASVVGITTNWGSMKSQVNASNASKGKVTV